MPRPVLVKHKPPPPTRRPGRPKKETPRARFEITIPLDLFERLNQAADSGFLSNDSQSRYGDRSEWIAELIRRGLNRLPRKE